MLWAVFMYKTFSLFQYSSHYLNYSLYVIILTISLPQRHFGPEGDRDCADVDVSCRLLWVTDQGRVCLPGTLVERIISQAAKSVTVHGQNPDQSVELKPGTVHVSTGGIGVYVFDPDKSSGDIALSLTRGSIRFVGGLITKGKTATIRTPTATIGIRGGGTLIIVLPDGTTKATFLFGKSIYVHIYYQGLISIIIFKPIKKQAYYYLQHSGKKIHFTIRCSAY